MPKLPVGHSKNCIKDYEAYLYQEWEYRLQLELDLFVNEPGALRFIEKKNLHTKFFYHDEALHLFYELNQYDRMTDQDRADVEIALADFEQVQVAEVERKATSEKKKVASRKIRKESNDQREEVMAARERGIDLFNTFTDDGELDDTPISGMTKAEEYLASLEKEKTDAK